MGKMTGSRASTQEGDATLTVLRRLRQRIASELHDYPYPIAGCDEAFKLLSLQRECCRVALGGLARRDGLTPGDAATALRELVATPLPLTEGEIAALIATASAAERAG